MNGSIEVTVGDANDVEAHVIARFAPSVPNQNTERPVVRLEGVLRGPFCHGHRTLPAEYAFRPATSGSATAGEAAATVVVPDPCLWSPDLPHVYLADLRALQDNQVIATYQGEIGLRRLTPRREGIAFPG